MKDKNLSKNVMSVVIAVVVMSLILLTVPLTSTPAKVFGGYGGYSAGK